MKGYGNIMLDVELKEELKKLFPNLAYGKAIKKLLNSYKRGRK